MERSSKFLTQRARPGSNKLITTEELCSMAHLVELLNRQSLRMTDRVSSGLQLSLQGQNILYIQAFDDARRQELANILEKEKWKGSNLEFRVILDRVETLPSIMDAFKEKQVENGENNNEEDISTLMEKFPGAIIVSLNIFKDFAIFSLFHRSFVQIRQFVRIFSTFYSNDFNFSILYIFSILPFFNVFNLVFNFQFCPFVSFYRFSIFSILYSIFNFVHFSNFFSISYIFQSCFSIFNFDHFFF